jgi:urease accessory protein
MTRIELEEGARLFVREEIVLGRHGEMPGSVRQRLRVSYNSIASHDQELAVGEGAIGWDSSAVTGNRRALGSVLIVGPETKEPADLATPEPEIPATATMKLDARTVLISSLAKDSILLTRQLDTSLARYARQEEKQPSEA